MITNKNIYLENSLNLDLDIKNILLLNLNYKEEKVNDSTNRDISYLIKKKDSIFNKVIKNNCSKDTDEIFNLNKSNLDISEKYKELILDRNENQEDENEETLEQLIDGMKASNKIIEKQIMDLYKESFVKKSIIPQWSFNKYKENDDIDLIRGVEQLLGEFVNEKNKNLNL